MVEFVSSLFRGIMDPNPTAFNKGEQSNLVAHWTFEGLNQAMEYVL